MQWKFVAKVSAWHSYVSCNCLDKARECKYSKIKNSLIFSGNNCCHSFNFFWKIKNILFDVFYYFFILNVFISLIFYLKISLNFLVVMKNGDIFILTVKFNIYVYFMFFYNLKFSFQMKFWYLIVNLLFFKNIN